jgi:hypothetical protein
MSMTTPYFAQIIAFFSNKIDSLTLNVMTTPYFAQIIDFFSNKIDSLTLNLMTASYFAQIFTFFSNKIDSFTLNVMTIFPKLLPFFLAPKLTATFNGPNFLTFF